MKSKEFLASLIKISSETQIKPKLRKINLKFNEGNLKLEITENLQSPNTTEIKARNSQIEETCQLRRFVEKQRKLELANFNRQERNLKQIENTRIESQELNLQAKKSGGNLRFPTIREITKEKKLKFRK